MAPVTVHLLVNLGRHRWGGEASWSFSSNPTFFSVSPLLSCRQPNGAPPKPHTLFSPILSNPSVHSQPKPWHHSLSPALVKQCHSGPLNKSLASRIFLYTTSVWILGKATWHFSDRIKLCVHSELPRVFHWDQVQWLYFDLWDTLWYGPFSLLPSSQSACLSASNWVLTQTHASRQLAHSSSYHLPCHLLSEAPLTPDRVNFPYQHLPHFSW